MPSQARTRNRSDSHRNWITNLFSAENLISNDSIDGALQEFQRALQPDNIASIVGGIAALQSGQVLALICSGVQDDCILLPWLSEEFPNSFTSLPTSMHHTFLSLLSTFLLTVEDAPASMHHEFVVNIPPVAGSLSRISFLDERSRRGRSTTVGVHDIGVFRGVGLRPPRSLSEKDAICADLLRRAKEIFELYISALRSKNISGQVMEHFVKSTRVEEEEVKRDVDNLGHLQLSSYLSTVGGFGRWKILVSTRAEQDLRSLFKKEPRTFEMVLQKMRCLSHGRWSEKDRRKPYGVQINVPIYQAIILHFWLLFQVDCVVNDDSKGEIQVINIYGLYKHNELRHNGFWKAIGYHLTQRGKLYEQRCTVRDTVRLPDHDAEQYVPRSFPMEPGSEGAGALSILALPPDDIEQIQFLNMFSRFYPFSEGFLEALRSDLPVGFFLQLSAQEKVVIEHPLSCYVVGRSGTGKTLTILHKILLVERASEALEADHRRPRQVFVTKSKLLAMKVEQLYHQSAAALRLRNGKWHAHPYEDAYSLLINYDDETVGQHYARPASDLGGLDDADFPLFTSFDDLCRSILETAKGTPIYKRWKDRRIITITDFRQSYWPTFSDDLKQGLDSTMVFNEILGVIEGSMLTLEDRSQGSALQRNDYEKLSTRAYPTFAEERSRVYSIFQQYHKLKAQRSEYDAADRTRLLLNILYSTGFRGHKIDFLYVDEVQDNLLIDALLLRSICANPNGMFWAGDTAQSIAPGSSFRFSDLKRLIFEIEQRNSAHGCIIEPPKLFHLAVNFRSHRGISHCAGAIVDVIARFWPNTLDLIPPEDGLLHGPKPLFLCGWGMEASDIDQRTFYRNGQVVDFGADQCILVRNPEAQRALRRHIRGSAIVLTLYQCKGMEFDDVLLYNFFQDSPASISQWRLMQDGLDHAPAFDSLKHGVICTELKHLYVAITRARRSVWIVDSSWKAEPMQRFWSSRDLIIVGVPGPDIEPMAVVSTPQQLEHRGKILFHQGVYENAQICFARAGKDTEARIAGVYQSKFIADNSTQSARKRCMEYKKAAEGFQGLAESLIGPYKEYWRMAGACFQSADAISDAVQALCKAELHSKAARLYLEKEMFDDALTFVRVNREDVDEETHEDVLERGRKHYFLRKLFEKALKTFTEPSSEAAIQYLEERTWVDVKIELLIHLKRFSEAGDVYKEQGHIVPAITLWIQAYKTNRLDDTSRKIVAEIVLCLWEHYRFGTDAQVVDQDAVRRLLKWGDLIKHHNEGSHSDRNLKEMAMLMELARILMSPVSPSPKLLTFIERSFEDKEELVFLIGMHHYSRSVSNWSHDIKIEDLLHLLKLIIHYVNYLTKLSSGSWDMDAFQKLFGASVGSTSGDGPVQMYAGLSTIRFLRLPKGTMLHMSAFKANLEKALARHIQSFIANQDSWCSKIPYLAPKCLYIINSDFRSSNCSRHKKHHTSQEIEVYWKVYAYQLRIVNKMLVQQDENERAERLARTEMRNWLDRLYCALNSTLGCHPPWGPLPGYQETRVQAYMRIVRETRLEEITEDQLQATTASSVPGWEVAAHTIRSLWMLGSIWAARAVINGIDWKGERGSADHDVEGICKYFERLATTLVVVARLDDLDDLKLPGQWDNKATYRLGGCRWNSTSEEDMDRCWIEVWTAAKQMLEECMVKAEFFLNSGPVIVRLFLVLYTLARENESWLDLCHIIRRMKLWSGRVLSVEQPGEIESVAEMWCPNGMIKFVNASSARQILKGPNIKLVIFERVDFSWLEPLGT